jgi:hypothetical protein
VAGSLLSQSLAIAETRRVAILDQAAAITAQDIKLTLTTGQQFASAGAAEIPGASLVGSTPLAQSTVKSKLRRGSAFPLLPRVDTGEMLNSIRAIGAGALRYVQLTGERSERVAIWQQFGTMFRGRRHIPPRPFFGISSRAMQAINAVILREETKLNDQLSAIGLPTIRIHTTFS